MTASARSQPQIRPHLKFFSFVLLATNLAQSRGISW